jgi:asparagine synthase (glutamine-hydrolysing)
LTVRSPYLDNNFVRTVFRAPQSASGNGNGNHDSDVRLRLIGDGSPELRQIPSDRGVGGVAGPIKSAIARAFWEFTFKAEYAYDYGMPQWVAQVDHLFSPLRPERLFLGRHKFLHYRVWYRDALAGYVRDMLLDPKTLSRPYLQPKTLERMVTSHLKGDRNYTTTIHKMLTMELLHRQLFDAK